MRERFRDAANIEDLDERARVAKWAINSESRKHLDALTYLAQSERPISDAGANCRRAATRAGKRPHHHAGGRAV
jgi:hypothetical protein